MQKLPGGTQSTINKLASQRNNEVLTLAFAKHSIEKRHRYNYRYHKGKTDPELVNEQCQCAYCTTLRQYVALKLIAHRMGKKLYSDAYYGLINKGDVDRLILQYQRAKARKDRIKQELKI